MQRWGKLKPIKPKGISGQVFDQLRELISRGEFKTAEKILTERELAQAFGVSRTSVRDAINKLAAMGLLEHKQGQGTFVRSPESSEKSILATMVGSQDVSFHMAIAYATKTPRQVFIMKIKNGSVIETSLSTAIVVDQKWARSQAGPFLFHHASRIFYSNPSKKSLPLSSTRINAGKSLTVIM